MNPLDNLTFDVLPPHTRDVLRGFRDAFDAYVRAASLDAVDARVLLGAACESGATADARDALSEALAALFVEASYLRQRHTRGMDECNGAPARVAAVRAEVVLRQTAAEAAALGQLLTHAAVAVETMCTSAPGEATS